MSSRRSPETGRKISQAWNNPNNPGGLGGGKRSHLNSLEGWVDVQQDSGGFFDKEAHSEERYGFRCSP